MRRFEADHRGRRTVLGKIDQLLAPGMIDPVVRRAGPGDAGPLAVLEGEARQALVDARGGERWLEEHPEIAPRWADAVAERERVRRRAGVRRRSGPRRRATSCSTSTATIAHVDQVYVTPEARELGFGDALLEAATEAARAGGATVLEGQALPGDRDTKNLYERAGITARLITVSRRL